MSVTWSWDHQDRETRVSSDLKNAEKLQCPYCSCLILNPGVGVFTEKQVNFFLLKNDFVFDLSISRFRFINRKKMRVNHKFLKNIGE
jgi:hypothetical protein